MNHIGIISTKITQPNFELLSSTTLCLKEITEGVATVQVSDHGNLIDMKSRDVGVGKAADHLDSFDTCSTGSQTAGECSNPGNIFECNVFEF